MCPVQRTLRASMRSHGPAENFSHVGTWLHSWRITLKVAFRARFRVRKFASATAANTSANAATNARTVSGFLITRSISTRKVGEGSESVFWAITRRGGTHAARRAPFGLRPRPTHLRAG